MKDIDGNKHGPDVFMELVFAPGDDARVRALIKATEVCGGVGRTVAGERMWCEFRSVEAASFDMYVDDRNAEKVFGNISGKHSVNVWIYGGIHAGAGRVWFEQGYGDYALLEAQMRILKALAEAGAPAVTSWSIEYGGQGYTGGVLKSGTSTASLRDYLGI